MKSEKNRKCPALYIIILTSEFSAKFWSCVHAYVHSYSKPDADDVSSCAGAKLQALTWKCIGTEQ